MEMLKITGGGSGGEARLAVHERDVVEHRRDSRVGAPGEALLAHRQRALPRSQRALVLAQTLEAAPQRHQRRDALLGLYAE